MKLLGEYFKDDEFSDDEWEWIEEIVEKILAAAVAEETVQRNTRWSISRLEFDNMYCFGKGNSLDLSQMSGITGIFGPNKSGKSSVIGSIIYGLFNTTDRGPMKNLHVINGQTGYCRAKLGLTINGSDFSIERQSVRHENKRKGEIWASTGVNFARVDDDGAVIEDLNGIQRSETDAKIRQHLGTVEDLLLTHIAAQRGPIKMDRFLNEGPTARRAILSRFMGLDIYLRMYELLKKDAAYVELQIEKMPDCDWEKTIDALTLDCSACQDEIDSISKTLRKHRRAKTKVDRQLEEIGAEGLVLPADVESARAHVASLEAKISETRGELSEHEQQAIKLAEQRQVIEAELSGHNIKRLQERWDRMKELERSISDLRHELEKAQNKLSTQERSVRKLGLVPCGDEYPTCKFIKDSHQDKKRIEGQCQLVEKLQSSVDSMASSLEDYDLDELHGKIERHRVLTTELSLRKIEQSECKVQVTRSRASLKSLRVQLRQASNELMQLELKVIDTSIDEHMAELKSQQRTLRDEIRDLEGTKLEQAETKGRLEAEVDRLVEEQEKYVLLKSEWRVYERMLVAWSKKGIPAQIIASQLPVINSEITRILHGITDFTLELEAGTDSNAMDIYIDDGVTRRIFELSSGMECLIGCLAIRVALINISSLPKTDFLIIDEGFGALDEVNVEAASRLLHSLKRWFRNIILITHVDSMKDVVDNVIVITKDEKHRSQLVYP